MRPPDGYAGQAQRTAGLADNALPIARAYALNDDERVVRALVLQLKLGAVSVGSARRTCGVDIHER